MTHHGDDKHSRKLEVAVEEEVVGCTWPFEVVEAVDEEYMLEVVGE
jgi:hypothetical protein